MVSILEKEESDKKLPTNEEQKFRFHYFIIEKPLHPDILTLVISLINLLLIYFYVNFTIYKS